MPTGISSEQARTPDDLELVGARRDLRAERFAAQIKAEVDGWPPLTSEQRARLAQLLAPGGGTNVASKAAS